jgi:hypothetical protein
MGWDFISGASKQDVIQDRTRNESWVNEKGERISTITLGFQVTGEELWVLRRVLKNDVETDYSPYISVCLLAEEKGYGWGYKEMDESSGPYYYLCPKWFLDAAKPVNNEWRIKVKTRPWRTFDVRPPAPNMVYGQGPYSD